MRLEDWMRENGWTDRQLADALGLKERLTVLYWRRGDSIPRPKTLAAIIEITGGRVQPSDFYAAYQPHPSKAEEVV